MLGSHPLFVPVSPELDSSYFVVMTLGTVLSSLTLDYLFTPYPPAAQSDA